MNPFIGARFRQRVGARFQFFVAQLALDGIRARGKNAFDPLIEKQAGAINELVKHPGRQIVGQRGPVVSSRSGCREDL